MATAPDIRTLIRDIHNAIDPSNKGEVNPQALKDFYDTSGMSLVRAIESPDRKGPRPEGTIYASELRDIEVCPRKLWYKVHKPETAETLMPHVRVKFMYGDMIEALAIFLADQAGHKVTHLQHSYERKFSNGIKVRGRLDCRIDGHVVDVKSCSTFAFNKMVSADYNPYDDPFGYMRQVQFYDMEEAGNTPDGRPSTPYLLLVDKQLGTMGLRAEPSWDFDAQTGMLELATDFQRIAEVAADVFDRKSPPSMGTEWVGDKDFTNGNRCLDTYCSYCPFKSQCWRDQGVKLRGFAYSNGPKYLTKVNKVPKSVPEFPA